MSSRRKRAARGAAAVEFALVLPFLVALCLGAIEWGFYFFQREIVVNAAREGARAGSIAVSGAKEAAESAASGFLTKAGVTGCTATADMTDTSLTAPVTVSCPGGSFTLLFKDFIPSSIVATAEMRR